MNKDELTAWALRSGWRVIGGYLSLAKPKRATEAIVRLVFKTTVVNLEVKTPAGKWEKVSGQGYARIQADPDTGLPLPVQPGQSGNAAAAVEPLNGA